MSARTFTANVVAPSQGGVPNWFTSLSPLQWGAVAGGAGQLTAAALQPDYVWPTDPNDPLTPASPVLGPQGAIMKSPSNYCQNSNGMAVDPVTGDCFLVANGGHGGYMGNETMRLNLRTETPVWERWVDSTPPWHISAVFTSVTDSEAEEALYGTASYLSYTDGPAYTTPVASATPSAVQRRPAAMHTACVPIYSEGKVWYMLQNSTNLSGGKTAFSKLALNVAARRNDPSLKFWKYGDIRPWEYLGVMTEQGDYSASQGSIVFPVCSLDTSTGRIWMCPAGGGAIRYFWMMETRGPNAGRHQVFRASIDLRPDGACAGDVTTGVVDTSGAPVKLMIVYGRRLQQRDVYVLNITALEAANPSIPYSGVINSTHWAKYVASDATPMRWVCSEAIAANPALDPSGTWGPQQAWGAFWHEGSKGLLMFNCDQAVDLNRQRNGYLRKLAIPLNAAGQYNPALPWRYHEVVPPNGNAGIIPGVCIPGPAGADGLVTGGSFSRFNIMRNFDGVGNDLVVSVNAWDNATSVMKIPSSGV